MKTFCALVFLCCAAYAAAAPGICTAEYAPVCAVNGQVYSNDCMRKAANVEKDVTWKKCIGHPLCPMICTLEYNPVCGPDGVLYGNKCAMQSAFCGRMVEPQPLSYCD